MIRQLFGYGCVVLLLKQYLLFKRMAASGATDGYFSSAFRDADRGAASGAFEKTVSFELLDFQRLKLKSSLHLTPYLLKFRVLPVTLFGIPGKHPE